MEGDGWDVVDLYFSRAFWALVGLIMFSRSGPAPLDLVEQQHSARTPDPCRLASYTAVFGPVFEPCRHFVVSSGTALIYWLLPYYGF
jgi:hypothetical protein